MTAETAWFADEGWSPVESLSSDDLQRCDAGVGFRSSELAADNTIVAFGDEEPWARGGGWAGPLRHPTLERVLLHFSRRTQILILLKSSDARRADLCAAAESLLERFGVLDRVFLAGDPLSLARFPGHPGRFVHDTDLSLDEAVGHAEQLDASGVLAPASAIPDEVKDELEYIVLPDEGHAAPDPDSFRRLEGRVDIRAWAAPAVDRMRGLTRRKGLVLSENFDGPALDESLWAIGISRNNSDTSITVDQGLRFVIEGENYSGGAAFSEFAAHGDFDARVDYEVPNPAQGATLELAVVHIDAGYHRPNLTFDVHGAPPYASSERDESDGFRIGWNNGPALTRWINGSPQSSNLYNNYSRDVGVGTSDRPTGQLRLIRSGEVFGAYYRDPANPGWVLSGAVPVSALARSVFFRLGAKHWPKRGNPAPDTDFTFSRFRLYQW
ncbi:MAG: hypothetical protein AAF297_12660 [Planctomycetota bacterium]